MQCTTTYGMHVVCYIALYCTVLGFQSQRKAVHECVLQSVMATHAFNGAFFINAQL